MPGLKDYITGGNPLLYHPNQINTLRNFFVLTALVDTSYDGSKEQQDGGKSAARIGI